MKNNLNTNKWSKTAHSFYIFNALEIRYAMFQCNHTSQTSWLGSHRYEVTLPWPDYFFQRLALINTIMEGTHWEPSWLI